MFEANQLESVPFFTNFMDIVVNKWHATVKINCVYPDDLPVIQSDKKTVSRDKQRHVILIAV